MYVNPGPSSTTGSNQGTGPINLGEAIKAAAEAVETAVHEAAEQAAQQDEPPAIPSDVPEYMSGGSSSTMGGDRYNGTRPVPTNKSNLSL